MMFIGTETLLTQLENERSRVHTTEVPTTGQIVTTVGYEFGPGLGICSGWMEAFLRRRVPGLVSHAVAMGAPAPRRDESGMRWVLG